MKTDKLKSKEGISGMIKVRVRSEFASLLVNLTVTRERHIKRNEH